MTQPTSRIIEALPVVAEHWAGEGPPIVFLHAGVCDRRAWREVAELLAGRRQVVTYDQRGFGDTPLGDAPFRHVDDLILLLERLTAESPAQLVGSSMGGQLALDVTVLREELVSDLVLFAPAVSGAPEPEAFEPHTQRLIEQLQAAGAAEDLAELIRLEAWMWLDGPGSPEGRVSGPQRKLMRQMNEIILRNDPPESAEDSGITAWQRLADITIPVTVAWGTLDVPSVIDQCQQLIARLPNATGQALTGLAHLPYLEDPQVVAELIDNAL